LLPRALPDRDQKLQQSSLIGKKARDI